jgi:hypothetical protein
MMGRLLGCGLAVLAFSLTSSAGRAAELTFTLPIENGRVPEALRTIRVQQKDVVTLKWSSDRPLTIHLHGYDIEKEVKPGAGAEMKFTARATGRFTVETHGGSGRGPPLVTVEIYP